MVMSEGRVPFEDGWKINDLETTKNNKKILDYVRSANQTFCPWKGNGRRQPISGRIIREPENVASA